MQSFMPIEGNYMVAHVIVIYKVKIRKNKQVLSFFFIFYLDEEENVDEPNLEITMVSCYFGLSPKLRLFLPLENSKSTTKGTVHCRFNLYTSGFI